jgi:hypothetical protein
VIARLMVAYWTWQDGRARLAYATLMNEARHGGYDTGTPAAWERDVGDAADRKALTYTQLRKWELRRDRQRTR